MSILISIFISGYHGKMIDFAKNSSCHRTTVAHFLNSGKWDDSLLENALKASVVEIIYSEALRSGMPVFCIVDDTIASKTKPSSQALHPIEDAYFHQSHLKGKQDYGHQAVAVMLSCNGIVLNYAFVLYNKSISKIDIVQNIAKELPEPPVMSYFLCDCWYVSEKVINTFAQKGFHTIGALKTNRMLYPSGVKKKLSELAAELSVTQEGFDLVTVKKRKYYVYRYEGNLNGIENAVVLLSYPEKSFGNPKALRGFISTNLLIYSYNFRCDMVASIHLYKLIQNISTDEVMKDKIENLVNVEQSVRNVAAHEIVSVTPEWIKKKNDMTPKEIMGLIRFLCVKAGMGAKKEDWDSYEQMNQKIIEELQLNV